jgi:hypothetical protein
VSALRFRPVPLLVGLVVWAGAAASRDTPVGGSAGGPDTRVVTLEASSASLDAAAVPFDGPAWASAWVLSQPPQGRTPPAGGRHGGTASAGGPPATPFAVGPPAPDALLPAYRAADALARSGAYSAPSTAPPTRRRA